MTHKSSLCHAFAVANMMFCLDQVKQLEADRVAASGLSFSSSHKSTQASVESEAPAGQVELLTKENEQLMALVRKHDGLVAQMQKMLEVSAFCLTACSPFPIPVVFMVIAEYNEVLIRIGPAGAQYRKVMSRL